MKAFAFVLALAVLAGNGLAIALDSIQGDFENTVQHRVSMIDEATR